jgi:hypothetical protein
VNQQRYDRRLPSYSSIGSREALEQVPGYIDTTSPHHRRSWIFCAAETPFLHY